tara:strand:- start:1074 stop:1751 length:678 start_codon:yes stop_codon:yes gene_type:complete
MSTPSTLREALLHDVMVQLQADALRTQIKHGLEKPPKCIKNWGIEQRWVGNCSVPFKLPKEAINILQNIIYTLISYYVDDIIDWTPPVRDLQDDKPELLFVDEYGWCKNSSSEGGRLITFFSGRIKTYLWKYFRSMKKYSEDVASDDVILEKIQERRRRLVINMYIDSFMMTWHTDNLRKILLLRRTNKEIKNLLDSEDDMSWVVMFEEPTNTTILLTKMLKSYA